MKSEYFLTATIGFPKKESPPFILEAKWGSFRLISMSGSVAGRMLLPIFLYIIFGSSIFAALFGNDALQSSIWKPHPELVGTLGLIFLLGIFFMAYRLEKKGNKMISRDAVEHPELARVVKVKAVRYGRILHVLKVEIGEKSEDVFVQCLRRNLKDALELASESFSLKKLGALYGQ
jgi:hypothetical protein